MGMRKPRRESGGVWVGSCSWSRTTFVVLMIGIQRLEAESRGEPIGIVGVVIVRVAVRVHIAEVVVVVVIRRTLPPVRSRTHGGTKTPNRQVLQKYTHKSQNTLTSLCRS